MPTYQVTLRADVIYEMTVDAEDEAHARVEALLTMGDDYEVDFDVESIEELGADEGGE